MRTIAYNEERDENKNFIVVLFRGPLLMIDCHRMAILGGMFLWDDCETILLHAILAEGDAARARILSIHSYHLKSQRRQTAPGESFYGWRQVKQFELWIL